MTQDKRNTIAVTPDSPAHAAGNSVGLVRPLWWMLFGLDAVLLSWFFQSFKQFTTAPELANGSILVAATGALLLCSSALIYDGYAREKSKGLVKNTVPWFDKLYAYQTEQRNVSQ